LQIPIAQLKEKKKQSGVQKTKAKQIHQATTKLHLLKAAKVEELKAKKKSKKNAAIEEEAGVLERFKKKAKK
jgi:hypothetical protein